MNGISRFPQEAELQARRESAVALIFGMDGDGSIAQHRLRPRCRDFDKLARLPFQRILDVVQLRFRASCTSLKIRKRAHATRTPVDQPLAPIDQTLFV